MSQLNNDEIHEIIFQKNENRLLKILSSFTKEHITNYITENANNLLIVASKIGSEKAIKYLLENYNFDVNWQNEKGETALLCATEHQNENILQLFLDKNADPNLSTSDWKTPIFIATRKQHIPSIQLLLKHNASIYKKSWDVNAVGEAIIAHDTNQEPLILMVEHEKKRNNFSDLIQHINLKEALLNQEERELIKKYLNIYNDKSSLEAVVTKTNKSINIKQKI